MSYIEVNFNTEHIRSGCMYVEEVTTDEEIQRLIDIHEKNAKSLAMSMRSSAKKIFTSPFPSKKRILAQIIQSGN